MKNSKKGFLNSLYGMLGQLVVTAFAFFLPKLVIENYGSETNGLLHSAAQIISYLSLFEAGVGAATIQALYAPVARNENDRISAIMVATNKYYKRTGYIYIIGVLMIALVYPALIHTELPYGIAVGVVLFSGLGGCISFFYYGKYALLMRAQGYSYVIEKNEIIAQILLNVTKYVLLRNATNVLMVQVAVFTISLLRAVIYLPFIRKKYSWIDYTKPADNVAIIQKNAVLVHQIATLIFSSTDVFLITAIIQDLKVVSVYTLYYAIVSAVSGIIKKLTAGFDFKLGQIFNTDRERYNEVYHFVETVDLISIFASMSALYYVFLPLIELYTRKVTDINYIEETLPLLFIITPLLCHGRQAAISTITFSGHYSQTQKYAIIESIINIVVSIPCIFIFGMPGALVGTIVASIYRTINATDYCYNHFLFGKKIRSIKRWLVCIALFVIIVGINKVLPLPETNSFILIGLIAVGLMLLFAMLYSFGLYLVSFEDWKKYKDILQRLRKNQKRVN